MRILLVILVSVAFLGCSTSTSKQRKAYMRGESAARAEIAKGVLAYETFGYPAPWSAEFEAELKEKFGIETRTVAGCVVNDDIVGHADGFNAVMDGEISRRFGGMAVEQLSVDMRKKYEERRAKEEAMGPTERRIRAVIHDVLSPEEQARVSLTILEGGRVKIDAPDSERIKIEKELLGTKKE